MAPEVITLIERYPELEVILLGGIVSCKTCRTILDIDRWLFDEVYAQLLLHECIIGVGNNNFRATPETVQYIRERRGKKI